MIVVNWNRRELLRNCLDSITAQQGWRPGEVEIIVVDNGSTDGSADLVPLYGARWIRNADNRGFCAANNQGIAAATGEFIALLNNDAEADSAWLRALATAFDDRPAVGMAASKILVHEDPRRIDKVGHLIYPDGQNRGRGSGEIDHGQYDREEEVLWPDGCAAMYRRAMLDQIGGFDEDLFAYADDAELGLRARIAGWRCGYVPRAVVRHHRGATLGVESTRRLELIERNRILLAVKLFPLSLLWRNGAYYLARIAAGIAASVGNRGETALYPGWTGKLRMATALMSGAWQSLPLIPRMWRKRRAMGAIRKLSPAEVKDLILSNRISLRELTRQSAKAAK